ncbi:hypothetical protein ACYEXS_18370 [Paenibacillus sp. MAH-36]|uniref:Uncharacterized protein n=1 Tax=Paenibacillus violae TaxID=3077234 RepID=A0ABU3RER8_9BACL|nr:hypothetical protein [Paenibacillus sp. PFR10]MDU0202780.1 hypothetical protein [Paenibacillus sp. PFR10]
MRHGRRGIRLGGERDSSGHWARGSAWVASETTAGGRFDGAADKTL